MDAIPSSTEGNEKLSRKVGKNLLAGAMARCMSATVMYPIDVVKTRLQFQRKLVLEHTSHANGEIHIKTYKNGFEAFKSILKEEGFSALYKGLPVRLIYITPAAAVSFTVYEQFMSGMKKVTNETSNGQSSWIHWKLPILTLIAGAGARVFGTACRTPFDILKQRLQVEGQLKFIDKTSGKEIVGYRGSGIINTAKQILTQEGLKGLWSGYGVTLLRDAPFASIYFTSYETVKRLERKFIEKYTNHKAEDAKAVQHLLAGALAGAIATTCTIPVDVVKTRLQTQGKFNQKHYDGIADAFRKIYREEGLLAFTKGLGPRLAYIMPAAAFTFTFYEIFKERIKIQY